MDIETHCIYQVQTNDPSCGIEAMLRDAITQFASNDGWGPHRNTVKGLVIFLTSSPVLTRPLALDFTLFLFPSLWHSFFLSLFDSFILYGNTFLTAASLSFIGIRIRGGQKHLWREGEVDYLYLESKELRSYTVLIDQYLYVKDVYSNIQWFRVSTMDMNLIDECKSNSVKCAGHFGIHHQYWNGCQVFYRFVSLNPLICF